MFQSPPRATVGDLRERVTAQASAPIVKAKRLANNTMRAELEDGSSVVLFHNTAIIRQSADGTITIDTGGYQTTTTRDRLNRFLPDGWGVHSQGGVPYLSRYLGDGKREPAIPFHCKATISPAGKVTPDVDPSELLDDSKLISRFMDHVKRTGLPKAADSGGDPWTFTPESVTEEIARDWLDSLYWTRRLFVLAMQKAGMADAGIFLTLERIDRAGGKLEKVELGRVRRLLRNAIGRG